MPEQHHPTLAPSSLDKRKHCPCWQSGEAGEAAEAGTEDHAALFDDVLRAALPAGRRAEVVWFADLVTCQRDEATFEVEQRLDVYDADFNLVTFGRADALDGSPVVWDYKSGQPADHEAQMFCYALGLMQRFDKPHCRVVIGWGRRMKVDEYYVTRAEAEEYLWPLLAKIKAGAAANERRRCQYCGWCALKLECPQFNAPVHVLRKVIAGPLPEFDPAKLDQPDHLAAAVRFIRLYVNPWSKAIEERAKAAALDGVKLPGLELTEKQGKRQIEDLSAAFQLLALPQDEFLRCCALALGKTEAVFSEHNTLTRARAKTEVARRLEPVTTRGEKTLSLEIIEEETTPKGE